MDIRWAREFLLLNRDLTASVPLLDSDSDGMESLGRYPVCIFVDRMGARGPSWFSTDAILLFAKARDECIEGLEVSRLSRFWKASPGLI